MRRGGVSRAGAIVALTALAAAFPFAVPAWSTAARAAVSPASSMVAAPGAAREAAAPGDVAVSADGAAGTRTVSAAALDALPSGSLTLAGRHGPEAFTGPSLWSVLAGTGLVPDDMRTRARLTVSVTGADGYVASFALAELDPGFAGTRVLLATAENGRRLSRPHLAVSGDRVLSRDVHDVVAIRIR